MNGSEKRRLDRYELIIPALVDSPDQLHKMEMPCLLSRDLSGIGGFFSTLDPLPVNALVRVGLILDFCFSTEPEHKRYSLIEVEGTVIRSEPAGMAVGFEQSCKISPIEGG